MPVTPANDAGWRIEPPVSVPVAAGARRAATAAELPPELPPGTAFVSHGFFTAPNAEFSFDGHRELVHVGLAERDHAGRLQAGDDGRVERALVVREHLRAGGRAPAARDEDILVRDRQAGERTAPRASSASAALACARVRSASTWTNAFRSRAASIRFR